MKRKLIAVLALAALVVAGASAQLMIGVSGALPLADDNASYQQIADQFKSGEGIFYGGFVELGLGRVGFGVSANTMKAYSNTFERYLDITDADLYASFHILGARSLLDPFAELGFGVIGTEWSDPAYYETSDWIDASSYWYVALGLGVNLGPVGISAKFAYNYAVGTPVELDDGTPAPAFGTYLFNEEYLPPYRVTIAAKLIL